MLLCFLMGMGNSRTNLLTWNQLMLIRVLGFELVDLSGMEYGREKATITL